LYIY